MLRKRSSSKKKPNKLEVRNAVGAYHARLLLASEVHEAESVGFWQVAVGDVPQPPAEVLHLDSASAKASGVSGAREVTDTVHPALEGKNSGMEPRSSHVIRHEPISLQPGDPLHLIVYVNVADSIPQTPLVLLSGPSDRELGQVEEIGPFVGGFNIEEGPLPFLAGLDDVGTLILGLAGGNQTAAGVGHVKYMGRLAACYSRRSCDPRPSVVSSEVEKPLPQSYTRATAEISFAESHKAGQDHNEICGYVVRLQVVEV